MLEYDNAKDAHTKLAGTLCLYEGRLAYIKNVAEADYNQLVATCVKQDTQKVFLAPLNDPKLNFMRFNLGYINRPRSSPWMFRRPVRQYRQGLTGDQCGFKVTKRDPADYYAVDFDQYTAKMLENTYPSFKEAAMMIKNNKALLSRAFHRDFAIRADDLHNDFVIEYKAQDVGVTPDGDPNKITLRPGYQHLKEYVMEVIHA